MTDNEMLSSIKEEALANHVPILQDVSLEAIKMILRIARPDKILEIGTAVGYSAIQFVKCLKDVKKDVKVKTIEIKEESYNIALKNIEKMGLNSNIEVINADAREYLINIDEKKEQFDVVFIDAAKGQYLVFLENAIRLVKNGGIIIADNVLFKGMVLSDYNEHKNRTAVNRLRNYLKIINEDKRLKSTLLEIGDGIAVSIVNK